MRKDMIVGCIHKIRLLCFFVLAGVGSSCSSSFLDVVPKGRKVAQQVADYDLLLNNLELINIGADAQVPMGDEVAAIQPYFAGAQLRSQRLFLWEDLIYEATDYASEINVPFRNIYLYNKIINEVPGAAGGTQQQKNAIEAEARGGRAWTNFLLINYFGKPYNRSTAADDPGIPIVTDAYVMETNFTRASVQDVYDFIIADLMAAIPNLPATPSHRIRMSRVAAEGLLGKVYLFMGDADKAATYLASAIAGTSASALPIALYNYNETFGVGGAFLPIGLFGPAYPVVANNHENLYGKQAYNTWAFFNNEFVVNRESYHLFKSYDLRLNFYSSSAYAGSALPSGFLKRSGPSNLQFGVVLPDLYLLRAEAKARLHDLEGARADVEFLRKHRMPEQHAPISQEIASQQTTLLRYIFDERIREFALQGYRWFDMRRLYTDPLLQPTTFSHTVYTENGIPAERIMLRPERLVLRFPQQILDENPGMLNNP